MNELESLRRLTEAVETAKADIAPTYIEYVHLAFAIATDCGEEGRGFFHRLCRVSAKYQREHAERIFSNALTANHGDMHLGTVFYLAEAAGVTVRKEEVANSRTGTKGTAGTAQKLSAHTCARNKVYNSESPESEELLPGSGPKQPLPTFPAADWPELLQRIMSYGSTDAQNDVMLLGALTALGSCMERYVRCPYGGKLQSPCMQSFIIALPASGKSALSSIRLLVDPIHDQLRAEWAEEIKAYKKAKAAYEAMGKERSKIDAPQIPANKMFLIAGNNTGTGILQNIMDANGTGFICESEADTLSTAIGSDYGHWSDTMRKAFDHDRLSYNRRTDREYQEVSRSYLSVLLSGTPAQVKPLIPTAENGLFSRQNFYYMPRVTQWADQFGEDEVDVDEEFRLMGNEWKNTLDELTLRGLFTLKLTHAQHKQFNFLFDKLFHRSGKINGDEMSSSVIRLAVNACRMMSIVAILRSLEDSSLVKPDAHISSDNLKDRIIPRWNMVITDDDFHAVLALVEPLYLHATHVLSFLSSSVIKRRSTADKNMLFAEMEDEFTRRLLLEKAHDRRIPESTALTWLKRLTKQGALVSVDGKGTYHKN